MDLQEEMYYRKYLKYKQKYLQSRAELEGGVNWKRLHPLNWFNTKPKIQAEAQAPAEKEKETETEAEAAKLIKIIKRKNLAELKLIYTYINDSLSNDLKRKKVNEQTIDKKLAKIREGCKCNNVNHSEHFSISSDTYYKINEFFRKMIEFKDIYDKKYKMRYGELHKQVITIMEEHKDPHAAYVHNYVYFVRTILRDNENINTITEYYNPTYDNCGFLNKPLTKPQQKLFEKIFGKEFNKQIICVSNNAEEKKINHNIEDIHISDNFVRLVIGDIVIK
jgi:hypothetical protein